MTDRAAVRGRLEDAVAAAVAGGADWVQVRDRALETRELAALVERVSTAARAAARAARRTVRVLVNRRVDVALAVGADGVHLGFDALSVEQARALLGPAPLIGVSAHDPAEVAEAARRGADYAHLAPIHA
ncbi:MAG: thiamine phosphate synthase, partial [Myxococcota bacterium]|nr:thiamine phosphate synthase [Myxococcota bacterium]